MISQIWIFRTSGIPVMSFTYDIKIEVDELLLTGMLSALFSFAENLKQGMFEALWMTNLVIFVSYEEDFYFVIGTEPNTIDETFIAQIINQIKQIFFQTFPKTLLERSDWENYLMPSSLRKEFQKKVDDIITKKSHKLSLLTSWNLEKAHKRVPVVDENGNQVGMASLNFSL